MSAAVDTKPVGEAPLGSDERDACLESRCDWTDSRGLSREVFRLEMSAIAFRIRGEPDRLDTAEQINLIRKRAEAPLALDTICTRFDLDAMERSLLLLALYDHARGCLGTADPKPFQHHSHITVRTALDLFGDDCLEKIAPDARLRRQGLVACEGRDGMISRRLTSPESVFWAALGDPGLSPDLVHLVQPSPRPALGLGEAATVKVGQTCLLASEARGPILLGHADTEAGPFLESLRAALLSIGRDVIVFDAQSVERAILADRGVATDIIRDLLLSNAVPIVLLRDAPFSPSLRTFFEKQGRLAVVVADTSEQLLNANIPQFSLPRVMLAEDGGEAGREDIRATEGHFGLTAGQLRRNARAVDLGLHATHWDAAKAEAGRAMGPLAKPIRTRATWDDLILPAGQKSALQRMACFLSQRERVAADWGFGAKSSRGLGMAALFHGASGTGKTTAAEILVREMQVPGGGNVELFRIDVSSLVSKYIGETAKNMAAVFDAGRRAGAALLFDEAEGLFAKRSQGGRDSLDKHSNAELGFLLQCLEDYPGVAILTTNMRHMIDEAFLRRFRFVIEFPFPDRGQREKIWKRNIPDAAPVHALDFEALSRLSLSGGNIRSIAVNAAFEAAGEDMPLAMRHMASATRMELLKLDKSIPESLLATWGAA